MRLFLLRRLYGLAQIVDGILWTFTPIRLGLPLKVAREIARTKGNQLLKEKVDL